MDGADRWRDAVQLDRRHVGSRGVPLANFPDCGDTFRSTSTFEDGSSRLEVSASGYVDEVFAAGLAAQLGVPVERISVASVHGSTPQL